MRALRLSNLIILMFAAVLSSAAVRHVPGEHPTIQAAIDDCNDGDTVIIRRCNSAAPAGPRAGIRRVLVRPGVG